MRNLHHRFVLCSASQIYGGDFTKFCGLLRIYDLIKQNVLYYRICFIFEKITVNLMFETSSGNSLIVFTNRATQASCVRQACKSKRTRLKLAFLARLKQCRLASLMSDWLESLFDKNGWSDT